MDGLEPQWQFVRNAHGQVTVTIVWDSSRPECAPVRDSPPRTPVTQPLHRHITPLSDISSKRAPKKRKSPSAKRRDQARFHRWIVNRAKTSGVPSDPMRPDTGSGSRSDHPGSGYVTAVSDFGAGNPPNMRIVSGTPSDTIDCNAAVNRSFHVDSSPCAGVPPDTGSTSGPTTDVINRGHPVDTYVTDFDILSSAVISAVPENCASPAEHDSVSGTPTNCDSDIADVSDSSESADGSADEDHIRPLSPDETSSSLREWIRDVSSAYECDPHFGPLLSCHWGRVGRHSPNRDFVDDDETVEQPKTAAQKMLALNALLGQLSHLCSSVIKSQFHRQAACIQDVWNTLYMYFGEPTSPCPH